MSSGLTALFTSLPGFLLLMVLGQNPDQKLPYFRYFPGTPGPSCLSVVCPHGTVDILPLYL